MSDLILWGLVAIPLCTKQVGFKSVWKADRDQCGDQNIGRRYQGSRSNETANNAPRIIVDIGFGISGSVSMINYSSPIRRNLILTAATQSSGKSSRRMEVVNRRACGEPIELVEIIEPK